MSDVVKNLGVNGLNPVTLGGTGTTIKYFPAFPGASIGVASTKNGYLYCPDNNIANNQRLAVRATGNVIIGNQAGGETTSPVITLGLYPVTFAGNVPSGAATISATAIVSQVLAAASEPFAVMPWALSADLSGDNASGIVQSLSGNIVMDGISGTFTSGTVLSGVNMNSPVPFGLIVGVTFSVSDPAGSANLFEFDLSM